MKKLPILGLLLFLSHLTWAQLSISLPISSAVYQETSSSTPVVLAGQYIGSSLANYRIEYEVLTLNMSNSSYVSTYASWATIVTNPTYGQYRTTMYLPKGWYQVNVRVWNISTSSPGSSNSVSFGVGQVYFIAGQSNAQSGSSSLPSVTTYDGVVSHNTNNPCNADLPSFPYMSSLTAFNQISPSGGNAWCWGYVADQLQSSTAGPIAFFNGAHGGTTVENWSQSAAGSNTTSLYGGHIWCTNTGYSSSDPAQPYFNFKTTLQYYGGLFGAKAVLWHQGESDNDAKAGNLTSRSNYASRLNSVISQSRSDFSSNLVWVVSEASFFGQNYYHSASETNSNITGGQSDVLGTYTSQGVLSDGYNLTYRSIAAGDSVHFREDRSNGVSTLGGLWPSKINSAASNPINSATPPTITMSKLGSNWTLSLLGTYSEYRWLNMASPNTTSPVGTGSSYSGSSGGSYACLAKNSSGIWSLSPTIYTNCGSCRQALTDWSEQELGIKTSAYPVPFDSQLTIEFTIPEDSRVRLELMDASGRLLSTVVNNPHAKGTYKYPVTVSKEAAGVLLYRLTVNGLAVTKKIIKMP